MHQFEPSPNSDQLTHEEIRDVMQLWEERQQAASVPTIRDLAETLRISPEQAGLLLGEVRARKSMPLQMPAARKATNEKLVFFGGLAAAICVMVMGYAALIDFINHRGVHPAGYGRAVVSAGEFAPAAPMATAKAGNDVVTAVAPEGVAVPTSGGSNR